MRHIKKMVVILTLVSLVILQYIGFPVNAATNYVGQQLNEATLTEYNVTETPYSADNSGSADATQAIQDAIDDASDNGGGVVVVPEGTYSIYPLEMRDNVTLKLVDAKLRADDKTIDEWITYRTNREEDANSVKTYPLIRLDFLSNVKIIGEGDAEIINAGVLMHNDEGHLIGKDEGRCLSGTVVFRSCTDAEFSGIQITEAVGWTLVLFDVNRMIVDNYTVRNRDRSITTENDGLDIVASSNITVTNCDIETADDGIVLKNISRYNEDDLENYRQKFGKEFELRTVENIYISDCILASGTDASKIGTETIGDFRNITFKNITVNKHSSAAVVGTSSQAFGGRVISAISVQSNDGANLENITFENYTITNADTSIFVVLQNRVKKDPNATIGSINNITFKNITAYDTNNSIVVNSGYNVINNPSSGFAQIGKLTFEDIRLVNNEPEDRSFLDNGIKEADPNIPNGSDYPGAHRFGRMPVFGMFARNADITLKGTIDMYNNTYDSRPMTIFENCTLNDDDVVFGNYLTSESQIQENLLNASTYNWTKGQLVDQDNLYDDSTDTTALLINDGTKPYIQFNFDSVIELDKVSIKLKTGEYRVQYMENGQWHDACYERISDYTDNSSSYFMYGKAGEQVQTRLFKEGVETWKVRFTFNGPDSLEDFEIKDLTLYEKKSLTVFDTLNSADWSIQRNFQIGDEIYGDRTYEVQELPLYLHGATWIRTANDSKAATNSPLAAVKVESDVDAYILVSDETSTFTTWALSDGFINTGDTAKADVNYAIYKKSYIAGETIILKPIQSVHKMYSIVLVNK